MGFVAPGILWECDNSCPAWALRDRWAGPSCPSRRCSGPPLTSSPTPVCRRSWLLLTTTAAQVTRQTSQFTYMADTSPKVNTVDAVSLRWTFYCCHSCQLQCWITTPQNHTQIFIHPAAAVMAAVVSCLLHVCTPASVSGRQMSASELHLWWGKRPPSSSSETPSWRGCWGYPGSSAPRWGRRFHFRTLHPLSARMNGHRKERRRRQKRRSASACLGRTLLVMATLLCRASKMVSLCDWAFASMIIWRKRSSSWQRRSEGPTKGWLQRTIVAWDSGWIQDKT